MRNDTGAVIGSTGGLTMKLRVHSLLESSAANGPGQRAVIWLQGCSLGCPGCWNPATHSHSAGSQWTVQEILAWLDSVRSCSGISGTTVSGGEPLEQAPGLLQLLELVRVKLPGVSIGLFSGYDETELNLGNYLCFPATSRTLKHRLWQRIRRTLDFAVLGRFNQLTPASDPLITSRNQRLRFYSGRYSPADFGPQQAEVTIDGNGFTQITGFPVIGSLTN